MSIGHQEAAAEASWQAILSFLAEFQSESTTWADTDPNARTSCGPRRPRKGRGPREPQAIVRLRVEARRNSERP